MATTKKTPSVHAPDATGGLWSVQAHQASHGARTVIVSGGKDGDILALVPGRAWDGSNPPVRGDEWRYRANAYAMAGARQMMDALRCALTYLGDDGTDDSEEARRTRRFVRQALNDATPPELRKPTQP